MVSSLEPQARDLTQCSNSQPSVESLYIVRHGQTVWNSENRMQGRMDSPLSQVGQAQAETNGVLLAGEGVTHLISSPLGRTRQTAALVNKHTEVPLEFDDALMERDVGEWGGLTVDEIAPRYPESWQARADDPYNFRPPGGENVPDMIDRVAPFLAEVVRHPSQRVGLVTHGALTRAILAWLLDLAPLETLQMHVLNDVVYRVDLDAPRRVSHYVRGGGPIAGLLQDR